MFEQKKLLVLHVFIILLTLLTLSPLALAAELSLTLNSASTSPYYYSMKVDQIRKLAGLKVIITHDKKNFQFVTAQKSKATNSFIHIANDKKEGQVIVVMAGAKGISGKDVELMTLEYKTVNQDAANKKPVLEITQCQLMGEDLKEISCSLKN